MGGYEHVLLLQLYVLLLQLQLQGRDGGGNVCGDSRLRCQRRQVYLHCKPSGLKCGYGGSGGHLRGMSGAVKERFSI